MIRALDRNLPLGSHPPALDPEALVDGRAAPTTEVSSLHRGDQGALFARHALRPVRYQPEEIEAYLERAYSS